MAMLVAQSPCDNPVDARSGSTSLGAPRRAPTELARPDLVSAFFGALALPEDFLAAD